MSQTREILAGFSGGARPDFASLRKSLAGATAEPSDGEKIVSANLGADRSSSENRGAGDPGGVPFSGGGALSLVAKPRTAPPYRLIDSLRPAVRMTDG